MRSRPVSARDGATKLSVASSSALRCSRLFSLICDAQTCRQKASLHQIGLFPRFSILCRPTAKNLRRKEG